MRLWTFSCCFAYLHLQVLLVTIFKHIFILGMSSKYLSYRLFVMIIMHVMEIFHCIFMNNWIIHQVGLHFDFIHLAFDVLKNDFQHWLFLHFRNSIHFVDSTILKHYHLSYKISRAWVIWLKQDHFVIWSLQITSRCDQKTKSFSR